MPRVSVVTGFYNRGPLLRRTIESILNQTFVDFELLVFDDKSKDGTADTLAELAREFNDERFRYSVHGENKGFVQGLKDAIADTSSEYIAIQGSGDASLPDRLARQVDYLDSNPDVAVVGGWYYNVQEGQGTRRLRTPDANGMGLNELIRANVFSHGEVMIRRSVYDAVGGYREIFTYAQDRDLWLRIAKSGAGFATIKEPVYERYVQFDGVSYVPSKILRQACFSIAAERLAQLDPDSEEKAVARILSDGVESFVGPSDRVVQGKLYKAAVRMVIFGDPAGGAKIARESLVRTREKTIVIALAAIYRSPFRIVLQPLLRYFLGLKPDSK